jgi:hypothetical protein
MTAYDINTIIRLHSSHLPMPLPFNEDYYYQSYLVARQRSPHPLLPRVSPAPLSSMPRVFVLPSTCAVVLTLRLPLQRESELSLRTLRSAKPSHCPSRGTPVRACDPLATRSDAMSRDGACANTGGAATLQTRRIRLRAPWAESPITA